MNREPFLVNRELLFIKSNIAQYFKDGISYHLVYFEDKCKGLFEVVKLCVRDSQSATGRQ